MASTADFAFEQPEEAPERRLIREYRMELERLRALVLYEWDHCKISPDGLDEMKRGLSSIIKGLDKLLRSKPLVDDDIRSSLENAQVSVRKARKCLHVASNLVGKSRSFHSLEALFDKYEEFADFLLEAIEHLDM